MSRCATIEAQVICPAVLSFLWDKFAPFLYQAVSWLYCSYLNLSLVFNFLDAWVSVSTPIFPRGTKIKDFFELPLTDYQIDNLCIDRRWLV